MKRRDWIILFAALALALGLFAIRRYAGREIGTDFIVAIDGQEVLRAPLAKDGSYPIRQDDGALNLVAVEDGHVFVREANCRDGLCMRQGRTNTAAKTLVCLPHRLTVRVVTLEGQAEDLDVVVQ